MLRLLALVGLLYAGLLLFMWLFQARLLYLPGACSEGLTRTPADAGLAYESVRLATGDDVMLHGWFVPAASPRGAAVFFHGNAGHIGHRLELIERFHELGLSLLIIDYRGYGCSEGTPSEVGTQRDARGAWRWLVDEAGMPAQRIVIAGRSLGAAVAAELARTVSPAAVILESPFRSVPRLAQDLYPVLPARWLARFEYATEAYVREIAAPVLVIHARDDEIVPSAHGEAVYAAANEPKQYRVIDGGHNTAFVESAAQHRRGIDAFLNEAGLQRPR